MVDALKSISFRKVFCIVFVLVVVVIPVSAVPVRVVPVVWVETILSGPIILGTAFIKLVKPDRSIFATTSGFMSKSGSKSPGGSIVTVPFHT